VLPSRAERHSGIGKPTARLGGRLVTPHGTAQLSPQRSCTFPSSVPSLRPLDGTAGTELELDARARWQIGSDPRDDLMLAEPGLVSAHVVLVLHDARWILWQAAEGVSVNGAPVTGATRLFDRDIIALSATVRWEFVSGAARTQERPVAEWSVAAAAGARSGSDAFAAPRAPFPWRPVSLAVAAITLIVLAVWGVRVSQQGVLRSDDLLSDAESVTLDSLLVAAYDHLERGNSLLELGVETDASQEFARGVNTLALSALRNHPIVRPRIEALEALIADIYRAQRRTVPDAYASAKSTLRAEAIRSAVLSREQFAHAFDLVSGAFTLRYGKTLTVVGRDHAEHLALYGEGGALDLRTYTLTSEEVAFVIAQCRSYGIRVKDFSQDSILRRQVEAARRAGLFDRAGTGLHLHIDRFADRRDRWTVSERPLQQQELEPRDSAERKLRTILQEPRIATRQRLVVERRPVEARVNQVPLPVFTNDRAVIPRYE
jgi:hypothetical protein